MRSFPAQRSLPCFSLTSFRTSSLPSALSAPPPSASSTPPKILPGGGVNRIGFGCIVSTIKALTPASTNTFNALPQDKIIDTLRANWFNGTDVGSQKAIAKSLIKLFLNDTNAPAIARETGVDATILAEVATSMAAGTALTSPQTDVYSRFDLILTARLDEIYQQGDQRYRNGTRTWAVLFALLLSITAAFMLHVSNPVADSQQT